MAGESSEKVPRGSEPTAMRLHESRSRHSQIIARHREFHTAAALDNAFRAESPQLPNKTADLFCVLRVGLEIDRLSPGLPRLLVAERNFAEPMADLGRSPPGRRICSFDGAWLHLCALDPQTLPQIDRHDARPQLQEVATTHRFFMLRAPPQPNASVEEAKRRLHPLWVSVR